MNIKIINIYEEFRKIKVIEKNNNEEIIYDFIYPASYMEHKNHKILIDTLIDLSKQNIFPKVLITLDEKSLLKINFHEIVKKYKLNFFELAPGPINTRMRLGKKENKKNLLQPVDIAKICFALSEINKNAYKKARSKNPL